MADQCRNTGKSLWVLYTLSKFIWLLDVIYKIKLTAKPTNNLKVCMYTYMIQSIDQI